MEQDVSDDLEKTLACSRVVFLDSGYGGRLGFIMEDLELFLKQISIAIY